MGPEADLVAPRFARGCRCFAVMIDQAVGGYGWLSMSPEWIGELQLEISPRPHEGYIWNCATLPEHRHKGIFGALLQGIVGIARHEGLTRLWIGSLPIPGETAVAKSGFQPALHFRTITFGALRLMSVNQSAHGPADLIASARDVLGSHDKPFRVGMSIQRLRHIYH